MDSLKKNTLPSRSPSLPKRNITLGSKNNVLQPNIVKKEKNLTGQMYNQYKSNRAFNIQRGKKSSDFYK